MQLQAITDKLKERRSFWGYLADAGSNLLVQAATILLVAGLFFGFRAADTIFGAMGRWVGVLEAEVAIKPAAQAAGSPDPGKAKPSEQQQ